MSVARPGAEWGIPVPGDPKQLVYVWFDALINYLAATGWPENNERFKDLWPADCHLMGKEIYVRFHATLWPAMLMALDLPLPKQVYAHGWWVDAEGRKGGKRTGGLPHPTEFAQSLAALTGADIDISVDSLRYLMIREMVFHGDSEYSLDSFHHRYNTDLANDLGNLCNRSVNMLVKYFDGVIPAPVRVEEEIAARAETSRIEVEAALNEFRFNNALESAWRIVSRMNRYIEERTPWKQAKNGEIDELGVTLYSCLEAIRYAATLLAPIMPHAARVVLHAIGADDSASLQWPAPNSFGQLKSGATVPAPVPIFPRIQDPVADASNDVKAADSKKGKKPAQTKQEKPKVSETTVSAQTDTGVSVAEAPTEEPKYISIDDFMKVELRVGNITAAEKVPNADKLLKLSVTVGEESRTILSGIAEMYQPEELVGRQVVVVVNLAPRKMRGIESAGMLLAADVDGQAILVQPETIVPSGARVR